MEWRLEWSPVDLRPFICCVFLSLSWPFPRARARCLLCATSHQSSRCILMPAARPLCSNSVRLKTAATFLSDFPSSYLIQRLGMRP